MNILNNKKSKNVYFAGIIREMNDRFYIKPNLIEFNSDEYKNDLCFSF